MRTPPTALATHIALGTTTLAHLLMITRTDLQVFAFTSADADTPPIDGVTYRAAPGLDVTSLVTSSGLAVDNLELTTLDDGSTFTRSDVLNGVWRNATFEIAVYNWASPSDGIMNLLSGTIGNVELRQGAIVAELRGLQQYLQQSIGAVASKTCRARLGDDMCGVNLATYTHTATITAVSSQQVFEDTNCGDPYYANVVLLLHGDGADASTTFTDSSGTPKTPSSIVGNVQIDTAFKKFGTGAILFDGTGDYLQYTAHADFDFGADDATVSLWWRPVSDSVNYALVGYGLGAATLNSQISWGIQHLGAALSGKVQAYMISGSTVYSVNSVTALTAGQWYHIEMCRVAGVLYLFLDGVLQGSTAAAGVLNTTASRVLRIGTYTDGLPRAAAGHIDDLQITRGVGRHTSAFDVPAAAHPNSAPAFDSGYFSEGIATFTSGACAGLCAKVKTYDGVRHTLSLPMLSALAVGDTLSMSAGCRKRLAEDCFATFNNVLNFQGEPHLTGIDALTAAP